MCGRYSQSKSASVIAEAFQLSEVPRLEPRYNIAPSQPVSAIVATVEQPTPRYHLLLWGLIPSWAKDPKIGSRLINARSETVAEKPSFRAAFKRRRCLILADGFYEWRRDPSTRQKQPYYFRLKQQQPFAFAGLWEHWSDPQSGGELETCTILTTACNELLESVHDRMPVILDPADYDDWLNPELADTQALQAMLQPFEADQMTGYAVGKGVNSPRHDAPDCLEPLAPLP